MEDSQCRKKELEGSFLKKENEVAGEMAQQFRVLSDLEQE